MLIGMDYYILGYNQMYILTHSLTHSLIHSFTHSLYPLFYLRVPAYLPIPLPTLPTLPTPPYHTPCSPASLCNIRVILSRVYIYQPAPACLPACLPCLLFAFLWLEIVAYYGYIDKAVHSGVRRWRWHWCLWGNNMSDSK